MKLTARKLRIFLADDHEVVRTGLKTLIESQADMVVVGEAADGTDAIARVRALKPDVAVIDVSMPGLGGAQTTREVRAEHPQLRIIALTVHEDKSHISELLAAGAKGYVLKRAASAELINAIRSVAEGGTFVDPRVADKLVAPLVEGGANSNVALSTRESEVLRLVALGYSHKEISAQLTLSLKSIETYKARSMVKLGLGNRVDIIKHAANAGWLRSA